MVLIPRIGAPTNIPLGGREAPRLNLPGGSDFRMAAAGLQMAGQVIGAVDQMGDREAERAARMYREELAGRKLDANGMPVVSAKALEDSIALRVGKLGRSKFRDEVQGLRLEAESKDKALGSFQTEANLQAYAAQRGSQAQEWARSIDGTDPAAIETFLDKADEEDEAFLQAQRPEDRPALKGRLADMRGKVLGGAESTFYKARDGFQSQEIDKVANLSMAAVETDMSVLEPKKAEVRTLIEKSDLPATVKQERIDKYEKDLTFAAARGLGNRDPAALQRELGGPTTEAGDYSLSGVKGDQKDSADFWRSQGLSGAAVAGILGTTEHEGGPRGSHGVNPGDGRDGSDSIGKYQHNGARAAELRKFAAARGKPWTDSRVQDEFALLEMKRDHPDVWRKLKAAKTPAEAVAAMNDFERPAGWKPGGDPSKVSGWKDRVSRAERIAGKVATERKEPDGPTNPLFADLAYEDRVKLQEFGERKQAQNDAADEKARAEADSERFNTLYVGILDGTKGQAEIDQARNDGWLRDASLIDKAQTQLQQQQQATAGATAFGAMLNSGATFNPFDDKQRAAADAYFKTSTDGSLGAAYSLLERTGILPPSAGLALRGGLHSNDPTKLAQAGSVASVLLAKNPAAFDQMEGGAEMRERAILFRHYTQDMQMSSEDAARRVMQESSAEYKSKAAPKDRVDAFREKLRKQDPGKNIIDGVVKQSTFLPGSVRIGNPAAPAAGTRDALAGDYNEFAIEGFKLYGDEGAAHAYAKQRVGEFWGVTRSPEGDRITRFPVEKLYQEPAGGWNKLYEQAAGDVSYLTKQSVKREDVWLVPIPTVTAETWRNGGRPPYQIIYMDRSGKVPILKSLPGEFEFDAKPTRRSAKPEFDAKRQRIEDQRNAPYFPMMAP
jgi:hypothetical protein